MTGPNSGSAATLDALVIGNAAAPEFRDVLTELRSQIPDRQLAFAATHGEALTEVGPHAAPDLVLILHQWPEEYTPTQALDLIDRFPLARQIVCYGPWCDSDGRTRYDWPLGVRIAASLAAARLRTELAVLAGSRALLPLTANRDDAYQFDYASQTRRRRGHAVTVAVRSPDPEIARWVATSVMTAGHVAAADFGMADVILWDVDPWHPGIGQQISASARMHSQARNIGLAGFLREGERVEMLECGLRVVVSKIAPVAELLSCIELHATGTVSQEPPQHRLRIAQ